MKDSLKLLLHAVLQMAFLHAGETKSGASRLTNVTLYISGVECPGCASSVNYAISQLKGVGAVISGQWVEDFVNVAFDPGMVTVHQLAHAVFDAPALHGIPYQAALKVVVPDYAKPGNTGRVDMLFKSWTDWVDVVVVDRQKGEFTLKFHPLQSSDPQRSKGLKLEQVVHEISAPKGLGLKLEIVSQKSPQ